MQIITNKIKNVLLDIDGTVLNPEDKYNPKLKEILSSLMKDKVSIGLSTNRSLNSSMKVYSELGLNGPVLFEDGAGIYIPSQNKTLKMIKNVTSLNRARLMIEEAVGAGKLSKEIRNEDVVFHINREKEYSISVHLRTLQGFRCDRIVADCIPAVESILSSLKNLITYDTGRGNFIIRYANSGKGIAVEYLIKRGMLDPKETLIIGDADNDVPAFRAIQIQGGLAGTVKNGTERAKALANLLSEEEYSNGVIDILGSVMRQ